MEARHEPVRPVADVGGDRRWAGGGVPGVDALGVRPRWQGAAGGPCGRHRHRSRLSGPRPVPGADDARARVGEGRGCRLRVQHPERPEPPRLSEDGLARGGPVAGCGAVHRPDRACGVRCARGCRPIVGRPNSTSACRVLDWLASGGPAGRLAGAGRRARDPDERRRRVPRLAVRHAAARLSGGRRRRRAP